MVSSVLYILVMLLFKVGGVFHPEAAFLKYAGLTFLIQLQRAIASRQENSSKLLRIEMENYHIIMKMGMY